MNKIYILVKAFLKNELSFSSKPNRKNIWILGIIGLCLMPMIWIFGQSFVTAYNGLVLIQQQGFLLGFIIAINSILIFVFGLLYVMSSFYFSNDLVHLLPLPIKPYEILLSKFINTLIYEFFSEVIFLLPFLILYGYKSNASIVYYLYALIIFLTLPVIPLCFASFINMLIMPFINISKNKDKFKLMLSLIVISFSIGINIFIQRFIPVMHSPAKIQQIIMSGNNSSIVFLSRIFPGSSLITQSVLNYFKLNGFIKMIEYLLFNSISIIIFIFIGNLLYIKGVHGSLINTSNKKLLSLDKLNKVVICRSPINSYILKEIRILFRTPAYFMNCVLMNFLWPIFFLIPVVVQPHLRNLLIVNAHNLFIYQDKTPGLVLGVFLGFCSYLSLTNAVGVTAISREGKNFFINKYIPLGYMKQIYAKLVVAIMMSSINILVLISLILVFLNPSFEILLVFIISSMFNLVFGSLMGLLIDLYSPKLIWDDERRVIKNNLNVFTNSLLSLIIAGIVIFIIILFQLTIYPAFLLIFLFYTFLIFFFYYLLKLKAIKLINKIEN